MAGSMLFVVCVSLILAVYGASNGLPQNVETMELRMKGAKPLKAEEYLCTSYTVPDGDNYIVQFEALANAGTAHHILVFGCERPHSNKPFWPCGATCDGPDQILFAWAKNADPLTLPKGVGRHIGSSVGIAHIVVQVHYARKFDPADKADHSGIKIYYTQQRQQFVAGIYLMLAYDADIPANNPEVHADIACRFNWHNSIFPFGYRTHAHSLGTVIAGYRVDRDNMDQYEQIGKGNPQWPQAFYPVKEHIEIRPGDRLAARCTYSSVGRNRATHIGATAKDEMCNFYIMYYMNASLEAWKGEEHCYGNNDPYTAQGMPDDASQPLPPNPALEGKASGHHHHSGMAGDGHGEDVEGEETQSNQDQMTDIKTDEGQDQDFQDIGNDRSPPQHSASSQTVYKATGTNAKSKLDRYKEHRQKQVVIPDYDSGDYSLNDYYDIMRQRNRLRKPPVYDLYNSNMDGFQRLASNRNMYSNTLSGKSRNRNKMFDAVNKQYLGFSEPDSTEDNEFKQYHGMSKSGALSSIKGGNSATENKDKNLAEANAKNAKKSDKKVPIPLKKSGSVLKEEMGLKFVSKFPQTGDLSFGQVGGLAVDNDGLIYVFHRSTTVWDSTSFDFLNNFLKPDEPINEDPVVILNNNGTVMRSFGRGQFYLPHGIAVDGAGNVWLTDVARHQVVRVPQGKSEPDLVLGQKFKPGSDRKHFCKPSDVAVMSTGEFFVSDGYCNARIVKFDKSGKFIKQWGTPNSKYEADGYPSSGHFNLPHSLALAEDKGLLCVADRENGRIQCFDLEGNFVRQMHPEEFGKTLYAVEYCPQHGGILFAVNGDVRGAGDQPVQGFTIDINTGVLLSTWNIPSSGLKSPHDVTVDSKTHTVYVGELNPSKVWKFRMPAALQKEKTVVIVGGKSSDVKQTSMESPAEGSAEGPADEVKADDNTSSMVIGMLLIIPVVLLIVITVLVRLYHTGHLGNCKRRRGKKTRFDLGSLLNSHKGFDRLSTEESDHELDDAMDDSDNEEFSITRNSKA